MAQSIMYMDTEAESSAGEVEDEYLFLRQKLWRFMEDLDKWLDPFEMIHLRCFDGTPSRVYAYGCYEYPPRFWDVTNEAFAGFIGFSGWTYTVHALPPDYLERRHEIESRWPQRRDLLNHIEVRIHRVILDDPDEQDECYKWYTDRAKARWRKVKDHVTTMRITNYWVHTANKPWSAGFMRGLEECSAGDWSVC